MVAHSSQVTPCLTIVFFDFSWVCWESSLPPTTSEPNSFIQLSSKEIFGGRGDAYTFSKMIFSSFHHNSFRDTRSWECVVKNGSVRSCLMELKSFLLSKFYVDPIHRVLMFLPLFLLVPSKTRCSQSSGINPEFVMECKLIAHPMW